MAPSLLRRTRSPARHQDAVEIARDTAPARSAAALARWARQLARSLLRLEQEHLVGLKDAVQALRAVVLDLRQETVAPAKGCIAVHPGTLRAGTYRQ